MYRKNTSGQFVGFQMVLTATGAIATGLSPTVRRCIDGTFAAATGTVTEDTGTGGYKFAMSQADTNGNDISFWFTATGAIPVCVNIVTTAADPTDVVRFGLTAMPNVVSGSAGALIVSGTGTAALSVSSGLVTLAASQPGVTIPTVTTVTNQLTAAAIATGVWTDTTAGDFTTALSVGKSVMNGVSLGTGLTVASVSGSVGSVTGLTASNLDATISSRMASYTQPTGFLAATFPTTVASPTNITAGTITTVTNLTNAPTAGDFTATMKASAATAVWTDTTAGDFTTALSVGKSLMNGVSLGTGLTVNDITTKTGYSLSGTQTFNLTGSITGSLSGSVGSVTGAVGSVTGAVGSVTGAVGSVTGNVGGNVVGSVASVTARVTANTDQFNGDATAAANIAKTTKAIVRATASGVPTTTSIPTSACTPAGIVADQFKGRIITFDADTTTTALRGQATDITASSAASTPTFTVTALTTAPVSGDTFSIT